MTVEVLAGLPRPAAQSVSVFWAMSGGMMRLSSARPSSAETSTNWTGRPVASPICLTSCRLVSDYGP